MATTRPAPPAASMRSTPSCRPIIRIRDRGRAVTAGSRTSKLLLIALMVAALSGCRLAQRRQPPAAPAKAPARTGTIVLHIGDEPVRYVDLTQTISPLNAVLRQAGVFVLADQGIIADLPRE